MKKLQKNREWDMMSSVDKTYLYASYQRYRDLLSASADQHERDSFCRWLYKRGIHKPSENHKLPDHSVN